MFMYPQDASSGFIQDAKEIKTDGLSQDRKRVGLMLGIGDAACDKQLSGAEQDIVRLTNVERQKLEDVLRRLKEGDESVGVACSDPSESRCRRIRLCRSASLEGVWVSVRTVSTIRQRLCGHGFEGTVNAMKSDLRL